MDPILWSILLLSAGLALIVLEVFLPSGGVLSFLAFAAIVSSIFVAFVQGGPVQGVIMLSVNAVIIPVVLALIVKVWPHTPIGRRILISLPKSQDEVLPDNEEYRRLRTLVGCYGIAKTKMFPAGAIVVEGQTFDAISEGPPIEPQQPIRVTAVRTNKIIVRPVDVSEVALMNEKTSASASMTSASSADKPAKDPAANDPHANEKDILSQPIDTLGIEPLDDPLA